MNLMKITCPDCGHQFEPAESHQQWVASEIQKKERELKSKFQQQEKLLKEREQALLASKESIDKQVDSQVLEKLSEVRQAEKAKAQEAVGIELKDLKAELEEKKKAVQNSEEQQLALRKQIREVQEKEKRIELEIEKKVQERLVENENTALKAAEETYRIRLLEKEKKIKDIEEQLEAAKRTANQGSQQTQGEAVEQEFEAQLQMRFPADQFSEVPKGVEGADLVQEVRNSFGKTVGTILWEFKNTKSFNKDWINKLREDQRKLGANAAILVTRTLSKDADPIECVDGVFVVSLSIAMPFAATIRKAVEELCHARAVSSGQDEKMKLIYDYLTGTEFKQKVVSIVKAFETIKDQTDKEKRAYARIWSAREKMLEQVIGAASSMYGDIEGIAGSALPPIESLALPEPPLALASGAEDVDV